MIRIEHLTKKFNGVETLKELDLEIRHGEIFTFIGPSGSGKTTLLRLIDLIDWPTTGRIVFDGQDTATSEAQRLAIRRRMGMVFQKPAVLNTTVAENVAFGLKFRGVAETETREKVREALERVGLKEFSNRRAPTLSGGEMQRVALARAMVTEPELLLLDEPTANLDPVSSEMIENLIIHINREMHTTIVMSTHDMIQGQRLADHIGVIMGGRLAQVGTINDIFYQPKGREIARFVGIDTILKGIVRTNKNGHTCITIGENTFEAISPCPPGQHVALYIRPEEVTVTLPDASAPRTSVRNQFTGKVTKILPNGPFVRLTIDCGFPVTALITRMSCQDLNIGVGMVVSAGVKATAIHVLPDTHSTPG
ncbi:MAG: ABC transporter ATP-binding protein [Methanoregula sp.]|nr:ABC transporter ATP-binding protein [Methanoregula sp.]